MLWVPHPNLFSHEYHFSSHQLTSQLPAPKSLCGGFPVATRARSTYTHVLGTDSPCLCGNSLQWMTDSRWLSINDAERTLVPLHPRWNITRCIFFSCSHNSPAGWCSKMLTCLIRTHIGGLHWWRSGWESACQCRGHGFEPWSGKIPRATEQLRLCATTADPARLEPVLRNERGCHGERPAHCDEEWPPLATTGESPLTETKTHHSQKNKLKKKKNTYWLPSILS